MLDDLASLILQQITSAADVCRFAQLCTSSSVAAAHDDVWRPLAVRDHGLLRALSTHLPGTRSYRSLYREHQQLRLAPASGCLQWSPDRERVLNGGGVVTDDFVVSIELRNHAATLLARTFTLDEVARPQTLELWGDDEAAPDCIAAVWASIRRTHQQGTRFRWSSALELSLCLFVTHRPSARTIKLVSVAVSPHFRDLLQPRHMTHPGEPASATSDRTLLVSSAPLHTRLLATAAATNVGGGAGRGHYWLALDGALDLQPRDEPDAHLLQQSARRGSGFGRCGAGRLSLWARAFVRPSGDRRDGPSEHETYLVRAQGDAVGGRVRGSDATAPELATYLAAALRLHRAPPERTQLAPWALGDALFGR